MFQSNRNSPGPDVLNASIYSCRTLAFFARKRLAVGERTDYKWKKAVLYTDLHF